MDIRVYIDLKINWILGKLICWIVIQIKAFWKSQKLYGDAEVFSELSNIKSFGF